MCGVCFQQLDLSDSSVRIIQLSSEVYKRLLEEERVPVCEIRHLTSAKNGRQNRSEYPTPIATGAEIIEIIWQLPGAAEFRRNCAKVCVRYLGGDETLVQEVRMNRRLQEQLQMEAPGHSARVFGEAVEQELQEMVEAVRRKREGLSPTTAPHVGEIHVRACPGVCRERRLRRRVGSLAGTVRLV